MTSIGMESENVFSQSVISQGMLFDDCKKKKITRAIDYKKELQKSLDKEDYDEASIIRDIIAKLKTESDLHTYRNRLMS